MPNIFLHTPARRRPSCQGLTLIELACILAVAALVVAGLLYWGAATYTQMRVTDAGAELQALVPALRDAHKSDTVTTDERVDLLNLAFAPDKFGKDFQGKPILLSPWKKRITVFPGSPMGWGADQRNSEFTVWFEDIPPAACIGLAMFAMSQTMRSLGLVSLYISHDPPHGDKYCLATDTYCKAAIMPSEDEIKASCHRDDADTFSLFLGYQAH